MNQTQIIKEMSQAMAHETLVGITRSLDGRTWRGYIVGLEDDWVLLHNVNGASMRLNGYTALRVGDITQVSEDESFAATALRLRGERPRAQDDLLLIDLPGLLSSAGPLFPLIAIFRETTQNGGCYIGKVQKLGRKRVTLAAVNRGGEWVEPYKFCYKDVTRIDLGDGYLDALWLVARTARREAR
jgi:hypothetical protein